MTGVTIVIVAEADMVGMGVMAVAGMAATTGARVTPAVAEIVRAGMFRATVGVQVPGVPAPWRQCRQIRAPAGVAATGVAATA